VRGAISNDRPYRNSQTMIRTTVHVLGRAAGPYDLPMNNARAVRGPGRHLLWHHERGDMKTQSASFVRASISFPAGIFQSLKALAKQKKVSLAWVVREATERYVAEETAKATRPRAQARGCQVSN
jgi:hypothetical protein